MPTREEGGASRLGRQGGGVDLREKRRTFGIISRKKERRKGPDFISTRNMEIYAMNGGQKPYWQERREGGKERKGASFKIRKGNASRIPDTAREGDLLILNDQEKKLTILLKGG